MIKIILDKQVNICYTWIKSSKPSGLTVVGHQIKKHLTKNKYNDILELPQGTGGQPLSLTVYIKNWITEMSFYDILAFFFDLFKP